jgi:phosphoribosylformylglycinamidine cyclo-ligase
VPAIFTALQRAGGVQSEEMWRTFNMGIGMVVVVASGDAPLAGTAAAGLPLLRIGEVVASSDGHRVLLR